MNHMACIALLSTLVLSACVGKKIRDFDPNNCNRHSAYQAGLNDGDDGRPMAMEFLHRCRRDLREQAFEGYKEGFSVGKNAYDTRTAEFNARMERERERNLRERELEIKEAERKEAALERLRTDRDLENRIDRRLDNRLDNRFDHRSRRRANRPNAWYCRINVNSFLSSFEAFGPTKLQAKKDAVRRCSARFPEMLCGAAKCQRNL